MPIGPNDTSGIAEAKLSDGLPAGRPGGWSDLGQLKRLQRMGLGQSVQQIRRGGRLRKPGWTANCQRSVGNGGPSRLVRGLTYFFQLVILS